MEEKWDVNVISELIKGDALMRRKNGTEAVAGRLKTKYSVMFCILVS